MGELIQMGPGAPPNSPQLAPQAGAAAGVDATAPGAPTGYGLAAIAELTGVPVAEVRRWVRSELIDPARGPRGELTFSFQDVALLRRAIALAAELPARKVRHALKLLKAQLPGGQPLTSVHLATDGAHLVARDAEGSWDPALRQVVFDFASPAPARTEPAVASLAERAAAKTEAAAAASAYEQPGGGRVVNDAETWFQLACDLEDIQPREARHAYLKALELAPLHADAHINLGRMLQEAGTLPAAEQHYRRALETRPRDATALFNLGTVLEDQQRPRDAIACYEQAIEIDPRAADAHYNLGRLCERTGDAKRALRHLKIYRDLTRRR